MRSSKKYRHLLVFFSTLLLSSSLLASVQLTHSIEDVYYRGVSERVGSFSLYVDSNDFVDASETAPALLEIRYEQQATLAETRVDMNSANETIRKQIYLPLQLDCQNVSATIAAPPHSLSIVRWVKGESSIWLSLQSSSSNWIRNADGTTGPPTQACRVFCSLGFSASAHFRETSEYPTTLPFPSRNPAVTALDLSDAEYTTICLDFSQSSLQISGISHLVWFYPYLYGPEAEYAPGLYRPAAPHPVRIFGGGQTARGVPLQRQAQWHFDRTASPVCSEQESTALDQLFQASFKFPIVVTTGMPQEVNPNSYLELQVPELFQLGFPENAAAFLLEPFSPGTLWLDPESAFDWNGQRLYRKLRLTWNDQALLPGQSDLPFQFALRGTCPLPPQTIKIQYGLWAARRSSYADLPPFEQHQRQCEPSWVNLGSGLFVPSEQPGDWMIPHVTGAGGGFETNWILANFTESPATLRLLPYSAEGEELAPTERSLAAGATLFLSGQQLFGDLPVSHCRVLGSASGTGLAAVYRSSSEPSVPAQVLAREAYGKQWRLYPVDSTLAWDGVAIVNRGAASCRVEVQLYSADGRLLKAIELTSSLAPNAKLLAVLSQLFATEMGQDRYYQIHSSEPTCVIGIRGNATSEYLWENPAIPLP